LGGIPATAAVLNDQTINSMSTVLNWSGSTPDVTGQGLNQPLDALCTPQSAAQTQNPLPCDIFTLHINLKASDVAGGVKLPKNPAAGGITKLQNYPNLPGDGVLVGIKWASDFDQWNLYVDDSSGNPVAASPACLSNSQSTSAVACGTDVDSNAQSVLIPWPTDGAGAPLSTWKADYTVKMVPFYTSFGPSFEPGANDKVYVGQARVFLDPSQRLTGHDPVLPRIQTMAPRNFHLTDIPPFPSNPTGWRYTPSGTWPGSCYLDEQVQYGSTKCLRFDNGIRNVGAGPLTLEFQYDVGALATAIGEVPPAQCHMNQEILWTDSATTNTATFRPAGPCTFHLAHAHFHYQNMGRYKLFSLGSDGDPHAVAWPDPGQGSTQPVAHSNKIGFCTIDVDDYTCGQAAALQRPRTYSFPTCNVPNAYNAPGVPAGPPSDQYILGQGVPEYMGIQAGWGDIYTWDLPTQYIDISHTPDGVYEVTSSSNPDGGIWTPDHVPPPAANSAANAAGNSPSATTATCTSANGCTLPSSLETGVTCIQLQTNAAGTTTVKDLQEFPSQPNNAPLPKCNMSLASAGPGSGNGTTSGPGSQGLPNTSAAHRHTLPGVPRSWLKVLVPELITAAVALASFATMVVPRRRRRRLG
jgi:hypothetical protein